MLRVSQIAKRLGVSKGKVVGWIRRGQLEAINVSDTTRVEYRVSEEKLVEFMTFRTVIRQEPVRTRRKTHHSIDPEYQYLVANPAHD